MSRLARLPLATVLAVCLLASLPPAVAQRAEPVRWGHGTHALRVILKNLDLQPLGDLSESTRVPNRTLLIVLGETAVLDRLPGGLRRFLDGGGAVLVATDRNPSSWYREVAPWEEELGIGVAGTQVYVAQPGDPGAYRGLTDCPIPLAEDTPPHPIFRGLQRVATNRPSYLQRGRNGGSLLVLATFPDTCSCREFFRQPLSFAAGGDWGTGRVLVLADHSVFINDMLLQDDNDNIRFAHNCLAWLADGTPRRDRVLLIEEGEVNANFDVPVVQPPIPPPGPWVNDLLYGAQKDNVFNRMVLSQVPLGRLLRGLLVALSAGLVLYGLVRVTRARYRVEAAALPLDAAVSRLAPAGTGVQQRHRHLLRSDNLWEPARALARQGFESVGDPAASPPAVVRGGWLRRRALRRQVGRLWELAYGPAPVRVTAQEFTRLPADIERLKAALADGSLEIRNGGYEQRG